MSALRQVCKAHGELSTYRQRITAEKVSSVSTLCKLCAGGQFFVDFLRKVSNQRQSLDKADNVESS